MCVYQLDGSGCGLFVLVSACACERCDANKRLASGMAGAAVGRVTAVRVLALILGWCSVCVNAPRASELVVTRPIYVFCASVLF